MKPTTIHALHPSGWPVTFEIEESDGKLGECLAKLEKWGYRPGIAGDTWPRTPEGVPICPKHGEVMGRREKQGDVWHSHSVKDTLGQEHYCRGYPGKNSPGYNIQ